MCGIVGVFRPAGVTPSDIETVRRMNEIQRHRGPDDEGYYRNNCCVLGHRRLAIIDLSSDGHQPFASDDQRFQLVFNGEIYNYIELRDELREHGWRFRTKTDTEVLLTAYRQYGTECLSRFNGMFAFAIYDAEEEKLFLARDRVGVKPLYYVLKDGTFHFSSEIKALRAIPSQLLSTNYQSLFDFIVFNRTDIHEETFFNEVKRLPKGCYMTIDKAGSMVTRWWNPEDYLDGHFEDDPRRVERRVRDILVSSVELRMRSDVPVGSCLSGGLDSSILVGILFQQHDLANGYPAFTASFPGHGLDETSYIEALNSRYGFRSIRTFPTAKMALENLRDFVYANDEPTTSASFYSQYEVMRLAKENGVTVLLDGQGGDENFAGYQYFHGFYFYELLRRGEAWKSASELLLSLFRKQDLSAYQTLLFQLLPDKAKKLAILKTVPYIRREFFYEYVQRSVIYNEFFNVESLNESIVRHFQYKLEHLLRMEDRNSMAFSLEARVPYLDYRLIEYVLSIPGCYKIKGGETKCLQKRALGHYTIPVILNRKDKIGFGTPVEQWMMTRDWRELTELNYIDLAESFPDIFIQTGTLPQRGQERWKINQLATWKSIYSN